MINLSIAEPVPVLDETGRLLNEDEFIAQLVARGYSEVALRHSFRFRRVCTGYPHTVALAYDRDLVRAAAATDEEVAEMVAAWERREGLPARDWQAFGREERDETSERT